MRRRQSTWLRTAGALIPTLTHTSQRAIALVRPVADPSAALRFRMETEAPAESSETRRLNKGDQFILDFGGHRTGHLAFDLVGEGVDAPVRLRLTFGEVPTDVAEPLYPYTGQLATGWLPDEIINVDYLPQSVKMARRHAFRYVKWRLSIRQLPSQCVSGMCGRSPSVRPQNRRPH
jgi:alpha-L-rhamnosidase